MGEWTGTLLHPSGGQRGVREDPAETGERAADSDSEVAAEDVGRQRLIRAGSHMAGAGHAREGSRRRLKGEAGKDTD